jgi:hypothetical protein
LFFVYFALLKGMTRDSHWQTGYVIACITQLCVEVFVYETSECVWIHYTIPQLVSKDIERTVHELKKSVNLAFSVTGGAGVALDAPSFLFVSTRVAKKFSHLFECAVVLAYHTFSPGRVAEKWLTKKDAREMDLSAASATGPRPSSSVFRRFSIFASLVFIMIHIGTLPMRLQKLAIHSIQPITVAVIIVSVQFLWRYPYWIAVPLVLLFIEIWRRNSEASEGKDMNQTNPSPGEQPNLSRQESGVVSSLSTIEPEIVRATAGDVDKVVAKRRPNSESDNVLATLGGTSRVNFVLPNDSSSDGPGPQVLRVVPEEEHSHASESSDERKSDDGWAPKGKQTRLWKRHVRGIFEYSSSSSDSDESEEPERDLYSVSSYSNSEEGSNEEDCDSELEDMETITLPKEVTARRMISPDSKGKQVLQPSDESSSSGSDIEVIVVRGAETVVCRL